MLYDQWPNDGLSRPWHSLYLKCVPPSLDYPREPLGWLLAMWQPPEKLPSLYNQQVRHRELLSQASASRRSQTRGI